MFFQKVKIYVVEDEVIIAEDLVGSLREMGHTVVGMADNAEDALLGLRESEPQVVLLDIHIEGDMDGIQLGNQVKNELGIPIIYLSAYIDAETRKRAKETGPVSFLSKPFDEKELEVAIKFALGKGSKLAALRKNDS